MEIVLANQPIKNKTKSNSNNNGNINSNRTPETSTKTNNNNNISNSNSNSNNHNSNIHSNSNSKSNSSHDSNNIYIPLAVSASVRMNQFAAESAMPMLPERSTEFSEEVQQQSRTSRSVASADTGAGIVRRPNKAGLMLVR